MAEPPARARFERVMTRVRTPEVRTVSDAELDELIERNGWAGSRRVSGRKRVGDPPIIFDTMRFPPQGWQEGEPLDRAHRNVLTHLWDYRDRPGNFNPSEGVVCQPGYGFHTARGCIFACDYCYFEHMLLLVVNLEALLERLDPVVRGVHGPTLWKWDNQSDTLCFEPEMGAARLFVEYFSQFDDKYLMLYTKSDNVDHLLDLDHRGRTIACWTLNAYTQSREIERGAATMEERIEAARKCQQAGYTVRFRFSAVCPVRDWERENREMLDLLFARVQPDLITLETLSRMPTYAMFENTMDPALFEPRFLEAIRGARGEMQGKIWGPFPDDAREEMYRFFIEQIRERSPTTPVALCQEPPVMWERLADVLEFAPDKYVCACAKESVPGHPRLGTSS